MMLNLSCTFSCPKLGYFCVHQLAVLLKGVAALSRHTALDERPPDGASKPLDTENRANAYSPHLVYLLHIEKNSLADKKRVR